MIFLVKSHYTNLYFRLTYIPAPYTIYNTIYKLKANHYIEFDLSTKNLSIKEINHVNELNNKHISFDEAKQNVNKLVRESVESRSISDVPIGTFLSGGVDSSIVSLCDDKRGKRFKINRLLKAIDYSGEFYWNIISLAFTDNEKENLFLPHMHQPNIFKSYKNDTGISAPKTITEFREIDRHISLEGDMLVKVDRTSMLNSLECRAPFLNKSIWEYTNSLPENYLMKGWSKKHILKDAFKDEFPANFTIIPLVKNHLSGKEDNTLRVWTYYCFQKWYLNTYSIL